MQLSTFKKLFHMIKKLRSSSSTGLTGGEVGVALAAG